MGLALTVFVPEGIVIASDCLEEVKNSDDGFLQLNQRKIFTYMNKYLVCVQCVNYTEKLTLGFYVNKIWGSFQEREFATTNEFASALKDQLSALIPKSRLMCYVVGIDKSNDDIFKFVVLMIDNNEIVPINKGGNGLDVYNYHSIGRSFWLNKILLRTLFKEKEQTISFDSVDIDFSKYSIDDAISFALTFLKVSRKFDELAQFKQMIGEKIYVGVVRPYEDIQIKEFS